MFWQGHLGKYRRAVLDQINLLDYLPTNMIEAISKSELLFTSRYHALDPSVVVLFPDWNDNKGDVMKLFGKRRLRIANDHLIKWKTYWEPNMVYEDMRPKTLANRLRSLRRQHLHPRAFLRRLGILRP